MFRGGRRGEGRLEVGGEEREEWRCEHKTLLSIKLISVYFKYSYNLQHKPHHYNPYLTTHPHLRFHTPSPSSTPFNPINSHPTTPTLPPHYTTNHNPLITPVTGNMFDEEGIKLIKSTAASINMDKLLGEFDDDEGLDEDDYEELSTPSPLSSEVRFIFAQV